MRLTTIALLLCMATTGLGCQTTGGDADPAWEELAWLTGGWSDFDSEGTVVEEVWTAPSGDSMLGVNRTVADGKLVFFEFLRIERDDLGFVYHAAPRGRFPPTPFRLVDSTDGRLVFENPAHDFPQRIIYEPAGGSAVLQIVEGVEDGEEKSSQWRLTRQ